MKQTIKFMTYIFQAFHVVVEDYTAVPIDIQTNTIVISTTRKWHKNILGNTIQLL